MRQRINIDRKRPLARVVRHMDTPGAVELFHSNHNNLLH